nr:P3 protein [Moroccan watermelon mosaic virus]
GNPDEAPVMPDIFKIIKCVYKQNDMCKLLFDEPYIAVVALHSPAVLIAMFNSGSLEVAIKYWIKRDQEVSEMFAMIETLAQKVSVARSIGDQFKEISINSRAIRQQLEAKIKPWVTYDKALELLNVFENTMLTNESLETLGYRTIEPKLKVAVEKIYTLSLQQAWEELSLREKLRARLFSFACLKSTTQYLIPAGLCASTAVSNLSPRLFINDVKEVLLRPVYIAKNTVGKACSSVGASIRSSTLRAVNYCFSDLVKLVNVLLVITLLMQVVRHSNSILIEHKQLKQQDMERKTEKEFKELEDLYMQLAFELKDEPTSSEFLKFVEEKRPKPIEPAKILIGHHVVHQ